MNSDDVFDAIVIALMAVIVVVFFCGIACGQTPQAEVVSAEADCSRLDPATARQTRYLTTYNLTASQRAAADVALSVQANRLSREGELVSLRKVGQTLWALCCDDYGWELTSYGALHEAEPYFHVKIRLGKEVQTAHAPWLPTKEIASLAKMTNSIVPILRADWWIWRTSQPDMYYQFLGVKKISDFERAVGLDRKLVEAKRKDLAGVIAKSEVTINARAVFRLQSSMGAWWESRDNRDPTGFGNPLRHLDKDYSFVAREFYITAPNGLFWHALATDKDDLIGEAPPDVASDHTSKTPDRRVICPRCDVCHAGQLRVPVDHFRKHLGGAIGLGLGVTYDRDKAKRIRSLYFGPLYEELAADNLKLAAALKRLGATPASWSKAYGEILSTYEDGLTADQAAAEFGMKKDAMRAVLRQYVAAVGLSDLGLAPYLSDDLLPRSHHQEMYPVLAGILYNPAQGVKP